MSVIYFYFYTIIFFLSLLLLPAGFTIAQTYTSNGNCFNWGDGNCWTKVDDDSEICTNNTSLFPPSNPSTTCPVKVVINHPITFASSLACFRLGLNPSDGNGFKIKLLEASLY